MKKPAFPPMPRLFTPDEAYERIKNSKLYPLASCGEITAFYLRESPDTRIMSTLVLFTPEGIVITGDLCPGRNGVIIRGYDLSWFASHLHAD